MDANAAKQADTATARASSEPGEGESAQSSVEGEQRGRAQSSPVGEQGGKDAMGLPIGDSAAVVAPLHKVSSSEVRAQSW